MKKRNVRNFAVTGILWILFVIYTMAIQVVDVQSIGPKGSSVGFAAVNSRVHDLFGVHMGLYNVTDWLGLVAFAIAVGFAVLGLVQLIQRKSLLKVDSSILVLGVFYILVIVSYLFFEYHIINYRPILIENVLEASYPSSTTLVSVCVVVTAMMQFHRRISNERIRKIINTVLGMFAAFMVIGRLVSGVHWFTDIIGGILLSAALVTLYYSFEKLFRKE